MEAAHQDERLSFCPDGLLSYIATDTLGRHVANDYETQVSMPSTSRSVLPVQALGLRKLTAQARACRALTSIPIVSGANDKRLSARLREQPMTKECCAAVRLRSEGKRQRRKTRSGLLPPKGYLRGRIGRQRGAFQLRKPTSTRARVHDARVRAFSFGHRVDISYTTIFL